VDKQQKAWAGKVKELPSIGYRDNKNLKMARSTMENGLRTSYMARAR
jgi:hypothetical protein